MLLRVLTLWRPAEWRRFDGMPEDTLKRYVAMADDTLEEWLEKLNRKDGLPYAVTFTESQINASCRVGLKENNQLPSGLRGHFKDVYISMRRNVLGLSLKSGLLGIGTVTVAVTPHVTAVGDVSAEFRYAKLGIFRIPTGLALWILRRATAGSKIDGLFSGKEIDPADVHTYFIAIQIDSIRVEDDELTVEGHIK